MNFKDSYKRDFDSIRADDSFKKQLSEELSRTAPVRRNVRIYTAVISAAAVIALAVGISIHSGSSDDRGIVMQGENITTAAVTEGLFTAPVWYGDVDTDEEIFAAFSELMGSGTIETLYRTEQDSFSQEDIVPSAEMTEMAEKLSAAVPADDAFSGNITECMAVFSGGEIVKFQITDNGLVKLRDCEAVFRYE